jgi:predicted metal-binding membrane protein
MRMNTHLLVRFHVSFEEMWVVMMVAMMLPCLAPMLLQYRRSVRPENRLGTRHG